MRYRKKNLRHLHRKCINTTTKKTSSKIEMRVNFISIFVYDIAYAIIYDMGAKRVLLGRHMKNRRFRQTEEVIIETFVREKKNDITMTKIAKKAGLGRSTLYVHHHAIKEILPDYERYMLTEYAFVVRKRLRVKNTQIKSLYFDMLVFILRNRKIFEVFLEFDYTGVFEKMIEKMRLKIISVENLPKKSKKVFRIYSSEVTEVIVDWGKRGFSENELSRVLSDIMYLTGSCRQRLMPLDHGE